RGDRCAHHVSRGGGMPTLTIMVRAGVAIRGGVTGPSVYTHRTWLLFWSVKPSMLGMPRFLRIQSLPAGSPGGTRKVGFIRGESTRLTSASSTIPRMAEADRIAEFKEVAVFLRRLEKAAG